MWIRTQDRERLINCDSFDIWDDSTIKCIVKDSLLTIATYKTKERALEVLDKIEAYIDMKEIFYMPKE